MIALYMYIVMFAMYKMLENKVYIYICWYIYVYMLSTFQRSLRIVANMSESFRRFSQ